MLIRPPHGNHGGQNMASGPASAYTTLGSSPMSCSSTAASHTEQSSLRHPPSSGPCHASQSERRPPAGGDGGWGGPERPPVPGLQPPPRHGPSDVPTLPIRRTGERLMERPRDGRVRGRGTITRAATTRRNHRRAAWGPRRPARRRPPAAARTTPSAREAHNPGRAPPNRNRRRTSRA